MDFRACGCVVYAMPLFATCAPRTGLFTERGSYSEDTRPAPHGALWAAVSPPLPVAADRLRSAESEGVVAGKVLRQGFSCRCEFVANEAHSHQPSAHRELFVFLLLFLRACAPQVFCHLTHCEAKLNVALELACVKSVLLATCGLVELEKAEFNRALCEGGVEVQHMVAAVVVVVGSAVVASLCVVPDVCKLRHRGGLLLVELLQEIRVYRSAVAVHAAAVNLDCFGDQRFVACHQVCEVSQALRCVSRCADVNVNSAASGVVALCACLAKASDQLLQAFDVRVVQDRCDQFALFAVRSADAAVALEFPLASLCVPSAVGFVAVAVGGVLAAVCAEELGCEFCCSLAGDVVHLNLNPDRLLLHSVDLCLCLCVHGGILLFGFWCVFPFGSHILTLNRGYIKPLKPQNIEENTALMIV